MDIVRGGGGGDSRDADAGAGRMAGENMHTLSD